MPEPLQVTAAEAGQKLLQFLSRRFEEPQSVLHRWIRTGQVRINGGRAKPFDRVELNDEIRVPPFAGAGTKAERAPASSGGKELPPIVAETDDVIVFLSLIHISLLQEPLKQRDLPIDIVLGSGSGSYTLLASDLGHEYVNVNADYRS